jgi:septum formation protein
MLILASSSARRLELLKQIGIVPDQVVAPACDETPIKDELPATLAQRLAILKAETVAKKHTNSFVLAGDSVVACGRRILPKCADNEEVKRCLTLLSGRRHRVYGGICVISPKSEKTSRLVQSAVTFKRLTDEEIDAYVKTGEGVDKAGGYALQGRAASFIRFISGSSSNIIGLPLFEAAQMLHGLGYKEKT